ncbi:hypothetical protein H072_8467 [Dactylellina haptotyla CBS 200.50]|uniref:Uncharacterized protein n=1 Tax=Dactylellina haptotyla (strain CBS 200.50) TaxID=1284197 RepID=S8BF59_DACHA|nr:hypothetical protein H072_8467 [Dactylellina haptotyla CBS 200.50]
MSDESSSWAQLDFLPDSVLDVDDGQERPLRFISRENKNWGGGIDQNALVGPYSGLERADLTGRLVYPPEETVHINVCGGTNIPADEVEKALAVLEATGSWPEDTRNRFSKGQPRVQVHAVSYIETLGVFDLNLTQICSTAKLMVKVWSY